MNLNPHQKRVILFQVKSPKEKIAKICQTAGESFNLKNRLLFRTPDAKASEFIDQVLWNYPVHSFLPHKISLTDCDEMICISHDPSIAHQSTRIFNLTVNPIINEEFLTIYDFMDMSTEEKKQISLLKEQKYIENKLSIASF